MLGRQKPRRVGAVPVAPGASREVLREKRLCPSGALGSGPACVILGKFASHGCHTLPPGEWDDMPWLPRSLVRIRVKACATYFVNSVRRSGVPALTFQSRRGGGRWQACLCGRRSEGSWTRYLFYF